MKNYFNPSIIYVLLWCLYSLQGTLYATGGIISRTLLLILLAWSIYSCFKVNFSNRKPLPSFIKAINAFLIVATIYGGILMLSGQDLYVELSNYVKISNFQYLKDIYISLLPIYTIYNYAQNGYITKQHIGPLLLLFIGITWVEYYQAQANSLAAAMAIGSTREEFTNNTGYLFLSILPLLLMWNKRYITKYILFIICIGGIILCMKRGAIIIGAVCAIYFIYSSLKAAKGSTKFAIVILSILAIIGTTLIVQKMLATSDYFVYRIESTLDGDSSNRDITYSNLWNIFINEPNSLKILFGRGANATIILMNNYAHNDWLELAINQGLLGVVIYVYYFIALLKDVRCIRRVNRTDYNVLLMSFFILFAQTLFSMSYNTVSIALALAIGLVLANSYTVNNNAALINRRR
ncbi:MAG: hypothetical protein J6U82_07175 [Alistipes sp.]|nr:hypothetical protein [Alistipes sp.]